MQNSISNPRSVARGMDRPEVAVVAGSTDAENGVIARLIFWWYLRTIFRMYDAARGGRT